MNTTKTEKQENEFTFNELRLSDLINCPTINVGGTEIKILLDIVLNNEEEEETNELLHEVETLLTEKEIEFLINTFSDNTIEKMIHKDHDLEELVSKNYESINNYLN